MANKRKLFKVAVFWVILFFSFIISPKVFAETPSTCTDSDYGNGVYTKGYVNLPGYGWDYCKDSNTVVEYACGKSGNTTLNCGTTTEYNCTDGCIDGACVFIERSSASPYIEVDVPNNTWPGVLVGGTLSIGWQLGFGTSIRSFEVWLYKGNEKKTLIKSGYTGTDNRLEWIVPAGTEVGYDNYKIRVSSTDQPNIFDDSEYFSIVTPITGSIKIISPNGSEKYNIGDKMNISWSTTGIPDLAKSFVVEIDQEGGRWMAAVIENKIAAASGQLIWTIPMSLQTRTDYRIRIRNFYYNIYDESDNYFSITNNVTPSVRVVSPDGLGEVWQMGKTYDITWQTYNINSVLSGTNPFAAPLCAVDLYKDSRYFRTLMDKYPVSKYSWQVPGDLDAGYYQILVRCNEADRSSVLQPGVQCKSVNSAEYPNIYDMSNSSFQIITNPNSTCVHKNPTYTTTTPVQTGYVGESKVYTFPVTVTNNDTGDCAPVVLDYRTGMRDGMYAGFVDNTQLLVPLAPGKSRNDSIWVSVNAPGANAGTNNIEFSVTYMANNVSYFAQIDAQIILTSEKDQSALPGGDQSCLPDNTLVRLPNDPKVYVIIDCQKKWIQTIEEFQKNNYKWSDVREDTAGTISALPNYAGAVNNNLIADGSIIQASGDSDVYIIKIIGLKKFKRLILSPSVFKSYGHLKWENIIKVDQGTLDGFTTSSLVRSENGSVYKLVPNGDVGLRNHIKDMTVFQRLAFDSDAVYQINAIDENSYTQGQEIE